MERYKTFPPRWSHIRVPLSSRAAAKAAVGLYAPCTPRGYAVQRAAWAVVSTLGPRALPGRAATWEPPTGPGEWEALRHAWSELAGDHDGLAVYQRPQSTRTGFAVLLLRRGAPVAFVRLRRTATEDFAAEDRVLRALEAAAVTSFWHPRSLGIATAGAWQSLVTSAMPAAPHRPVAGLDPEPLARQISQALSGCVPRPAQAGPDWEPMHGDFTPWNVRQVGARVVVIDWEDAGWGPPDADTTLYRATSAVVGGRDPGRLPAEAAAFWAARLEHRPADASDAAFGAALMAALRGATAAG